MYQTLYKIKKPSGEIGQVLDILMAYLNAKSNAWKDFKVRE